RGDGGVVTLVLGQALERTFELVFEQIGHGDQLKVRVGSQRVDDGLGAPTSATDEADFELFGCKATHQLRLDDGERGSGGGGGGGAGPFEEVAARLIDHL